MLGNEQLHIRKRLRESGRRLFATFGVVKTSIDQLTREAGIAKGSFYKFHDSKERLTGLMMFQTAYCTGGYW